MAVCFFTALLNNVTEGKRLPTELRDMDKSTKEDLGYDQAQEGKKKRRGQ